MAIDPPGASGTDGDERLLLECIERLESGESAAEVASTHPHLAEEIDRIARVWALVRRARTVSIHEQLERRAGAELDATVTLREGDEPSSGGTRPGDVVARLAGRETGFGRYTVQEEVGRGGMGAVLRVWDADLRRNLAMKVMRGDAGPAPRAERYDSPAEQRALGRFLEEAQVTGQLDHPGIVPVHELGIDPDGRVYFTMKLVKGRTLGEVFRLARKEPEEAEGWTRTRALGVILRVCEALAYAHDKGVLHRDLKPANVMVGRFGEAYVMDWGLARVIGRRDAHDLRLPGSRGHGSATLLATDLAEARSARADGPLATLDGTVVGTPMYMPPEQARGEVEALDERSDVYSLGAILYHLLAGRPPYADGGSPPAAREVLARLVSGPPRPLSELARDVPPELEAVCAKAMAREPERRYAGTLELAEDLRAFLEDRVVRAHRTGPVVELKKWFVRNRALASTAAAAAAVILVGSLVAALVLAGKNSDLVSAAEALEQRSYENVIAAADGALTAGDAAAARRYLEQATNAERGWEWRYLAARADRSLHTLYRHTEPVRCVATDGERIATYGSDEFVTVWAGPGDRRPRRVPIPDPGWPHQVVFDAGLARAAVPRRPAPGERAWSLDVYDLATGEVVRSLGGFDGRVVASFSRDGRLAAVADSLRVLPADADRGAVDLGALPARASAVAFSPDGARIATIHRGGLLAVRDAATGALLFSSDRPESFGSALTFSPDGSLLAASSSGDAIQLWDAHGGRPLQRLAGHTNRVTTLAFGPKGRLLASGSRDASVRIWDAAAGRELDVLLGHVEPTYAVFSPDGGQLISASHDLTVKVWETPRPGAIIPSQEETGAFWMFGTPGGERIAVRAFDGSVSFWDLERGARLAGIDLSGDEYRQGALSPDGTTFAATLADGAVGVWEFSTGRQVGTLIGHAGPVLQLAWHPGEPLLASASADGTARVWSFAQGAQDAQGAQSDRGAQRVLGAGAGPVRSVSFGVFDGPGSTGGALLVTGGDDGAATVWDTGTGERVGGVADAGGAVWHAVLLAGGARMAIVTSPGWPDYALSLWDLEVDPPERLMRTEYEGWIRPFVAPTPDGERFVLSNIVAPRIPVFDARTGTRLLALRGEIGENFGVVTFAAAGGERLLAHNDRGELLEFDATPGRAFARRMELRAEVAPLVELLFEEHLHRERVYEHLCLDAEMEEARRRAALEVALADPRDRKSVLLALGQTLIDAGRPHAEHAEALDRAERLASLEPTSADAARTLAYALYRTGDPAGTLSELERARTLAAREPPTALAFEALALLDLDRHAEADEALARARDLLTNGWNSLQAGAHAMLREAEHSANATARP